jgi:hypothetical protein
MIEQTPELGPITPGAGELLLIETQATCAA